MKLFKALVLTFMILSSTTLSAMDSPDPQNLLPVPEIQKFAGVIDRMKLAGPLMGYEK